MILIIDGVDYSAYIQQKKDIVETPRRITGPHGGTMVDGTTQEDYITTKYDAQYHAKPLPDYKIHQLLASLEKPYVEIRASSVIKPPERTFNAIPAPGMVQYLTMYAGRQIGSGPVLQFTEK